MQITTRLQQPMSWKPLQRLLPNKVELPALDAVNLGHTEQPAALMAPPAPKALTQPAVAPPGLGLPQIEELIAKALSDPAAEKQLLDTLQLLNAAGQLKPMLHQLAASAQELGALPPMPEEKKHDLIEQAAGMIDAQFREHGLTPDTKGAVYTGWPELSARHLAAVRNTQSPRTPGGLSSFTNPAFIGELETLQGAKFESGNSVRTLMDGPASFAERDRMIDNAKTSIHLMTWAFYDDGTGWDTAKKLVEKAKEGVGVKVMVDGQVSVKSHHNAPIKFLEDNGVEVVRWKDSERPYDGNHRKMMIVDGTEAVAGGLNVGDVYSHRNGDVKWRDTDVLFSGPAVTEGERLFANLWNEQSASSNVSTMNVPDSPKAVPGGTRSALVNHKPGPEGDAHIMLATMKAIEGATESVDIENAYFINTPGMKDVLLKALADGVKVRLLTNSAQSIDEPLISGPILASLPDLVAAGAEVYLKKGDTLHSKFMTVDGIFSSVGSHNHHPRSQRFEGEMVVNSLDSQLAQSFTSAFEADIAVAQRIEKPEDVKVPESPLGTLALRYFFDAL